MQILSRAAWPCQIVEDAGVVVGFVMPTIPSEFYINIYKAESFSKTVGEFQHLLNPPRLLARRRIPVSDRQRYQLLAETAYALSIFHRHDITVGDLSPKNLLFALHPRTKVYFIDCDGMRLQGRSVIKQVGTPEWAVVSANPNEELATEHSDTYKLGLLALRLLAGDQQTRNPTNLPRTVPAPVRNLIERSLSPIPTDRPSPPDWYKALRASATHASTKPPKPLLPKPQTSPTPKSPSQPRNGPLPTPPVDTAPLVNPSPTPQTTTNPTDRPTPSSSDRSGWVSGGILFALAFLGPILFGIFRGTNSWLMGLIAGLIWLVLLFALSLFLQLFLWEAMCKRSRTYRSFYEIDSPWYFGITALLGFSGSYVGIILTVERFFIDLPVLAYVLLHVGYMICVSLIAVVVWSTIRRR